MYAVIRSGNKQFKVIEGQTIKLPCIDGEAGAALEFGEVLSVGGETVKIGLPLVEGATVSAKILRQGRDKKILVYKFKRRKGFEKMRGHRQGFTEVRIEKISA